MINGLDLFRQYFTPYTDQFVLIGGTACTINMKDKGLGFRLTKDLDIVLYVEALNEDFVRAFWRFVEGGGYQHKQYSTSKQIFYRFSLPSRSDYPIMLELFSRVPDNIKFKGQGPLTPIPMNDVVASLSAILLDEDYYQFIHSGKIKIDNLPILNVTHLIPIKAHAYLDLANRKKNGEKVDEKDIRKHKNDIIRLSQLLPPTARIQLPMLIHNDFRTFLNMLRNDPSVDCKSLGLTNTDFKTLINNLSNNYLL